MRPLRTQAATDLRLAGKIRFAKRTRVGGGKRPPKAGEELCCDRSAPLGVVMVPAPCSLLAPPRGAQGLGGWLEGLEFGLDFGFGEAHGLKENDVVAPYGLGVGVIEAQALPEDGKAKGHQRLRLY